MSNKTRDTIEKLANAIGKTMIPGEDEHTQDAKSLSMAISREKPKKMGNKSISIRGYNFQMPANFRINSNSSLRRLVSISAKFHVIIAAFTLTRRYSIKIHLNNTDRLAYINSLFGQSDNINQ